MRFGIEGAAHFIRSQPPGGGCRPADDEVCLRCEGLTFASNVELLLLQRERFHEIFIHSCHLALHL